MTMNNSLVYNELINCEGLKQTFKDDILTTFERNTNFSVNLKINKGNIILHHEIEIWVKTREVELEIRDNQNKTHYQIDMNDIDSFGLDCALMEG